MECNVYNKTMMKEEDLENKKLTEEVSRKNINSSPEDYDGLRCYLNEIPETELLSKDEERNLFEAFENAAPEEKVHIRNKIMEANLRWVVKIAMEYTSKNGVPLLDLIQEGNIGLEKAVDNFDYRKGFRFSTYSRKIILQAISSAAKNNAYLLHVPEKVHTEYNKIKSVEKKLTERLDRKPTIEEIAADEEIEISASRIFLILNARKQWDSLQEKIEQLSDDTAEVPEDDEFDEND